MKHVKVINLIAILVLLAAATFVPSHGAYAQSLTYESCFQVQNLDATAADITISYYAQGSSTPVAEPKDNLGPNVSKTYCPLTAVQDGFNGSVVISSTTKIAAIANVSGATNWSGYDASYAGFTGGANTVNLPLLFKNNYGFNTWYNVQNAGGSGTANVQVAYNDGTTNSAQIGVNQAKTFDQSTENHTRAIFAAKITSDQPIVVTVMEVGPSNNAMLFGYNGFTSAYPNPIFPVFMANNYGFTASINFQNTGAQATNVTVTYTPSAGGGSACTETQSIPAGGNVIFGLHNWDVNDPAPGTNNCANGATFLGSARVTANSTNQNLVAIINQHNFATKKGAAYGSFNPNSGTAKVVMPAIFDRNYGYFTGFNIVNSGTSNVTVSCTFQNSSVTVPPTVLPPGGVLNHVQLNKIANNYIGAATCTATGTSPKIIGVVNELLNVGNNDTFLVYEAFNN